MKKDKKTWNEFYKRELTLEGFLRDLSTHGRLFDEIISENPESILEVGTGSGKMSIFLSLMGYSVTGIDNNPELIKRAKVNCKKFNGKASFRLVDAFSLSETFNSHSFDLVFSQGFFEHFSNEEISKLIEQQLTVGNVVVFSVPSKYHFKGFGNERLLTLYQWREILEKYNVERIYYYGEELGIIRFFKNLVRYPQPPFKKPQHILIKIKGGQK